MRSSRLHLTERKDNSIRCTSQGDCKNVPRRTTLGINFPPVKDKQEILRSQRASTPDGSIRDELERDIPPMVRSVLEFVHLLMSGHSQYFRAAPGYAGGIFFQGSPYCFASGYRDGSRPRNIDDKENQMRLKDPLVYGVLSLPITAAYLCELHGKGIFDIERPLVQYLPDLQEKLASDVTARSILSFQTVLQESAILKDAGIRGYAPFFAWNVCSAMRRRVYVPLNHFLAGGRANHTLSGRQQRENFVQYLRSSVRFNGLTRCSPRGSRISHFSVALLIAAVEAQLKGTSFEDSIRAQFFEPAQSHPAGYGAPILWRDPNQFFYQPRGMAMQHQRFTKPVPTTSEDNCSPPLFNASLNLHSPAEEYAKLLTLSIDTIQDARQILGCPDHTFPHYDFGVRFLPRKHEFRLRPAILSGLDFIPTSSSFRYNQKTDLGCFGVSSCGSRNARLFAGNLSYVIQYLFVKHVLREGIDIKKPLDLSNPPGEPGTDTEDKFTKLTKHQKFTSYFKNYDAHKKL